jgi:hypothetical protein
MYRLDIPELKSKVHMYIHTYIHAYIHTYTHGFYNFEFQRAQEMWQNPVVHTLFNFKVTKGKKEIPPR